MKKSSIYPSGHYYMVFPGSFDRRYSVALSVEGALDTFLRQEDGSQNLVARFENRGSGASIVCGSVRPASAKHPEETALVGLLNGELMEVRFLDARRVWTHLISTRRITAVAYSAEASLILAGNEAGEVFVFDAETKKPVFPPIQTGLSGLVWIAWLAETRHVLLLTMDHQICLWDPSGSVPVARHRLITPMATAVFLQGSRLVLSSFAKDSGVCWVNLIDVARSGPLPVWRLTPLHLRIQALRPLSAGTIGVLFEDNSAVVVDEETGGVAEWKTGLSASPDTKTMDFFSDAASQTVTFCGQGFVQTLPLSLPPIPSGPGSLIIQPRDSQLVKYNLTFASLEDLQTDPLGEPTEE